MPSAELGGLSRIGFELRGSTSYPPESQQFSDRRRLESSNKHLLLDIKQLDLCERFTGRGAGSDLSCLRRSSTFWPIGSLALECEAAPVTIMAAYTLCGNRHNARRIHAPFSLLSTLLLAYDLRHPDLRQFYMNWCWLI